MPSAGFSAPMVSPIAGKSLSCVLLAFFTAAVPSQKLRNHFDSDALLREPAFFDFVVLGAPGEARWRVVGGYNPPSTPNHVAQVLPARPDHSIAVAVRRNATFRDGTWSVAMRRAQGQGGVVFRMAGEKDFLVLLIDLATGEAHLSAYRHGRPTELARGKAKLDNEWGILKINGAGSQVLVQWEGSPLLDATDPNPVAGRAGMATAGPGVIAFDEFVLDPAPEDVKR